MKKNTVIPVGEFKAHCLSLFESVRSQKQKMTITRRGKPIAQVIPVSEEGIDLHSELKDTICFEEDLISPIDVNWNVLQEDSDQ